jgi:hypothetical protein
VPVTGKLATDISASNGAIATGAVVALRVTDAGAAMSIDPAWVSHDVSSPGTPMIVNGVVFVLGTGSAAAANGRSTPAVLNAYDGATGKRLWASGSAMTTAASPGSFWSTGGQVFVGAHDGTVYAFGFNDERRAVTGQ